MPLAGVGEGGTTINDEKVGSTEDKIILLEPANPFDLSRDDLSILMARITTALPDLEVEVGYDDQFGAGGPWWQVLHLWVAVTFAEAVGYDTLLDICKEWLREQFRTIHGRKREKLLVVHELESGKEILSVRLDSEAAEYVVQVVDNVARKRPRGRHRKDS